MGDLDLTGAQWSKSSYSSANGACVEVARNLPGIVAVRDSKNPGRPEAALSHPLTGGLPHRLRVGNPCL